jgi:glutathione S-transferase
MNLHRPVGAKALSESAHADIARVQQIWSECRERYGKIGPYLFGAFSGADAMYAPVVHRFRTYAIDVRPDARDYMKTMTALPAFQQWTDAGLAETVIIDKFED